MLFTPEPAPPSAPRAPLSRKRRAVCPLPAVAPPRRVPLSATLTDATHVRESEQDPLRAAVRHPRALRVQPRALRDRTRGSEEVFAAEFLETRQRSPRAESGVPRNETRPPAGRSRRWWRAALEAPSCRVRGPSRQGERSPRALQDPPSSESSGPLGPHAPLVGDLRCFWLVPEVARGGTAHRDRGGGGLCPGREASANEGNSRRNRGDPQ